MNIFTLLNGGLELIKTSFSGLSNLEIAKLETEKFRLQSGNETLRLLNDADAAQTDIDKVEAQSFNIFLAGWRPALAWVCVFAFIYNTLVDPILHTFYPSLPTYDFKNFNEVLYGILGLGGMRTFEKLKNIHQNH